MDRFVKDNGIDENNQMTREQAYKLADEVRNSGEARIKDFNKSLTDYMNGLDSAARRPRLRGWWGGSRGQE